MSIFVALGISIGVLAGVLCIICDLLGGLGVPALAIAAWPAFVAWALYFAKGGGVPAMVKTITCNVVGIIMGGIIVVLAGILGFLPGSIALAIAVAIGAFVLCAEAHVPALDYIPAAFCGCAVSFGSGAFFDNIELVIAMILSMAAGAVFAHLSNIWGVAMAKKDA